MGSGLNTYIQIFYTQNIEEKDIPELNGIHNIICGIAVFSSGLIVPIMLSFNTTKVFFLCMTIIFIITTIFALKFTTTDNPKKEIQHKMITVNTDFSWKLDDYNSAANSKEIFFPKSRIPIDNYLLRHVSLSITNRCNLNCEYCYKSVRTDGCIKEIPFDTIKLFIDKLQKIEGYKDYLSSVQLLGGEPTLHPDFINICSYLISQGLDVRVSTNGTVTSILQSKELEKLYKRGNIEFRISLDEDINHDQKSSRGAVANTVSQNIKYLTSHGANVTVKSVITKSNINDIPQLLKYLQTLNVKYYGFSSLYNLGSADNSNYYQNNYVSDLEILKKLMETVKINPSFAPMIKANVINHMMMSIFIKNVPYYFTKFYMYVHYDGNIYCQDQLTYPEFNIGNIYSINLKSTIEKLKSEKIKFELRKPGCTKCKYYPFCTKGHYGELYLKDKSLNADFPSCDDLRELQEYIMTNHVEVIEYFKSLFKTAES